MLPILNSSIVLADNNPNWENAFTTNPVTNRPNSFTCLQSKSWHSNNSMYLVVLQIYLLLIKLLVLILIKEELKPISPTLSVVLSLTSSIIFYFNIVFTFMQILHNLIWIL